MGAYIALFSGIWILIAAVLIIAASNVDVQQGQKPEHFVNILGGMLIAFLPALAVTLVVFGLAKILEQIFGR